MKTLSLQQPWARAMTRGLRDRRDGRHIWKPVENRTWWASYRGPCFVHASQKYDHEGAEWIRGTFPYLEVPTRGELDAAGEVGALVGGWNVAGCATPESLAVRDHAGGMARPWAFGPNCFLVEDPLWRAPSGPVRGRLGLFDVDPLEFAGTVWHELWAELHRRWQGREHRIKDPGRYTPTEFLAEDEFDARQGRRVRR